MTRPPYPGHRCKKSDWGSPEWKAGFTPCLTWHLCLLVTDSVSPHLVDDLGYLFAGLIPYRGPYNKANNSGYRFGFNKMGNRGLCSNALHGLESRASESQQQWVWCQKCRWSWVVYCRTTANGWLTMEACFPSKGYCAIIACGKGFPYMWKISNQQEATQAIDISVNTPSKVRGHVVLDQYQVLGRQSPFNAHFESGTD